MNDVAIRSSDARIDVSIDTVRVDAGPVRFTSGGSGPTVLFLHGWGLGHHAYRRGLRRLARRGFRVVAPALPGFGGTPDLPIEDRHFAGYGEWAFRFARAAAVDRAIVVGHSFGGGVATSLCARHREIADGLMLMNSVGGSWRAHRGASQQMGERPWWDWTRHVPSDVVSLLSKAGSTMPSVLEDLVPNVVRNPLGVAKVGRLARAADLHAEFEQLRNRRLPVSVIHSDDDGVIPRSSFVNICEALGVEGVELAGNHSWPLTRPDDFAAVISAFAATPGVMKQLARPPIRR